ncbi:hypothetical protein ACFV9C_42100 [Kribbella sp. NPDC059898]|uniref:hypothetical protein n=1 Tax=Kribbella sp. NPDC059898 TaxID=3346995 RepID=UPI00365038E2
MLTDDEMAWIRLSHHVDQLEQFLTGAPDEIARRRAAGLDETQLADLVEGLQAILPGLRDLAAEHRVVETLGNLPAGTGLHFDELAAATGLTPERLTDALRLLEDDGMLGPGPHSRQPPKL